MPGHWCGIRPRNAISRKCCSHQSAIALLVLGPGPLLLQVNLDNAPKAYFSEDAPAALQDCELREVFPADQWLVALVDEASPPTLPYAGRGNRNLVARGLIDFWPACRTFRKNSTPALQAAEEIPCDVQYPSWVSPLHDHPPTHRCHSPRLRCRQSMLTLLRRWIGQHPQTGAKTAEGYHS